MPKCPSCQAENDPGLEVCFTCGAPLLAVLQGSVIANRYEIRDLIGKGGMGVVYRAHDRWLDETVALKVLRLGQAATTEAHQRFLAEIKLARKVTHPNVCRIHDYGDADGLSYISMELLEGMDLRKLLSRQHPEGLPSSEAFSAALQIAAGLRAIHEVGIIHRDLKTPNAMRVEKGVVKLMDFGIAKDLAGRGLTKAGEVMGTPEYMSPEQCRGEALDVRSDVYALGVVVFELFTGDVPFSSDNPMATLFKQIQEPVPFDGPLGSRLPPALVPVLREALAKRPAGRFGSVAAMMRELRRAYEATPTAPEPPASQAGPGPAEPVGERRAQHRLQIALDVRLCRLDSEGSILHEERSVADNISRRGARVMTSLLDFELGDRVILKEVGGDFEAPAVVRHQQVGPDHIPRVGLEFVGVEAPDRLVATEQERQTLRASRATLSTPKPGLPVQSPAAAAGKERRRHSRLGISVNVRLARLGKDARVLKEERTIADNISRGGARVLTSMQELGVGDTVVVKELDGDFEAQGAVRHVARGADNIPRVGIQFLDRMAPDRLVLTDDARAESQRLKQATATLAEETPSGVHEAAPLSVDELRSAVLSAFRALPSRNHFEILGVSPEAGETEVGSAYRRLARRFHPDSANDPRLSDVKSQLNAVFIRIGEAWEVLRDPEERAAYERRLGLRPERSRTGGQPAAPVARASPPAAPEKPRPAESAAAAEPPVWGVQTEDEKRMHRIEMAIAQARKLFAAERHWDAIQLLEPLVDETAGTRLSIPVRLLLGRVVSKNPKWLKRAEQILRSVLRDEPSHVEAYVTLGSVYRLAGLESRARSTLLKALELAPGHPTAAAELEALDSQSGRRPA